MAKSVDEILQDLLEARDKLLDAIAAGGTVLELEIRNRRVKYKDFYEALLQIENLISWYQQRGPSRNKVHFTRGAPVDERNQI